MSNVLRRLEFNCEWKPIWHRGQPTGSLSRVPLSQCCSPVRLSLPFMPTLERWTRITIQSMLLIKEVSSAQPQLLHRESRGNTGEDAPVRAAVIGRLDVPRSSEGCCDRTTRRPWFPGSVLVGPSTTKAVPSDVPV